ncbi:GNAT family N-acetyltransferase [Halochromatium salexigens]|nr:GNAT family N-acetyltransferase [Halochromatium salexigens]
MTQIEDSSLDCPELHGVLSPPQAIEGFRQQGQYAPQHWCILRHQEQDAGVLLLAPHPQTPCWELMYMGVLPAWRGQGLGRELVAEALRRTLSGGAERLLLSVDTRNHPARELYEQVGFSPYAWRSLYAWIAKEP